MNKKNLYPYILPSSILLLALLFGLNIFTGWFIRGPVCAKITQNCTLWRSVLYLSSAHSQENTAISDEKLAQILLAAKENFIKEMGKDMLTKALVENFNKELSSKENMATLITSLGNANEVKAIRAKQSYLKEEEEVVRHLAYESVQKQFLKYVEEGRLALIEKNTKILEKIMPTFVNYNDYVRFFDKLQSNLNTPQRPFKIENISVKDIPSQENFSDTLQVDFSLETTEDSFKEFLKAIYASGNLPMISSDANLLYPFLSVDEMKVTYPPRPQQSTDTDESVNKIIHADMKLIAYIKAITKEDIEKISQEIQEIEEKYTKNESFNNLPEEKRLKKENLLQYKSSYETLANNAIGAKEYRKAYTNLSNVKQIVTDLYNLSL